MIDLFIKRQTVLSILCTTTDNIKVWRFMYRSIIIHGLKTLDSVHKTTHTFILNAYKKDEQQFMLWNIVMWQFEWIEYKTLIYHRNNNYMH